MTPGVEASLPPDPPQVWYHGSPLRLVILRAGSSLTPLRRLAEVFSHKPGLVLLQDDGRIRHDGRSPGFLYRVAESVSLTDVKPHPWSRLQPGLEFISQRELALEPLGPVAFQPGELLSQAEIEQLLSK
jgi:hypothetical protein